MFGDNMWGTFMWGEMAADIGRHLITADLYLSMRAEAVGFAERSENVGLGIRDADVSMETSEA